MVSATVCAYAPCGELFQPGQPNQKYHQMACRVADRYVRLRQDPDRFKHRQETSAASHALRRARIRAEVINHYGGKCACCGETEDEFLCIDHIDGNGREHRALIRGKDRAGAGFSTYAWLRKNGFPPGFQVLCWNCNAGKERPGGCPHQRRARGIE